MITVRERFTGRCLAHPRFNPHKQGPGGVRGACPVCEAFCRVARAEVELRAQIERAQAAQDQQRATWAAIEKKRGAAA